VPKLWTDTIDEHRQAVRDATLDATAALVARHGLAAVTMSGIAAATGIGRATLYKYFPDVQALMLAWHERQVSRHLARLETVRDEAADARSALVAVLEAYALMSHEQHGNAVAAQLHRGEHVARAHDHLRDFVRDLIAAGAARGDFRTDMPAAELATFCLHALGAAAGLPSKAAVRRLVEITLSALRPPEGEP
jgi:AcrR family transcriptional regulator